VERASGGEGFRRSRGDGGSNGWGGSPRRLRDDGGGVGSGGRRLLLSGGGGGEGGKFEVESGLLSVRQIRFDGDKQAVSLLTCLYANAVPDRSPEAECVDGAGLGNELREEPVGGEGLGKGAGRGGAEGDGEGVFGGGEGTGEEGGEVGGERKTGRVVCEEKKSGQNEEREEEEESVDEPPKHVANTVLNSSSFSSSYFHSLTSAHASFAPLFLPAPQSALSTTLTSSFP
jgi:hypothetical protein